MESLEQLLGFRISGSPDTVVEQRRVEILSADFEGIRAVRPATVQEVDLWMALLGHEEGMKQAADAFERARADFVAASQAQTDRRVQLEADKRSLEASNEAYRLQLQKLYEGIKYIVHIEPTDDAVEKALQLINVAHNQPQAAEAAEKRRHEYVNRERFPGDPMNSVLQGELDKAHDRIAGRPVRDNPQA